MSPGGHAAVGDRPCDWRHRHGEDVGTFDSSDIGYGLTEVWGIAERSSLVQDIIQTGFSKTVRVARQQLGQELFKLIAGQHAPSTELQLGLSECSASPRKSLFQI